MVIVILNIEKKERFPLSLKKVLYQFQISYIANNKLMLHLVSITKYFGLLCSEFYYFIVRCDTDHDMVFILFSHKKKRKEVRKRIAHFNV